MIKFSAEDIVALLMLRHSTKKFLRYLTPKTVLETLPKVKPVPFYVGEVIKFRRMNE